MVHEQRDIALYIHWPFCVSKCPYCDFNSHVRESIDQQAWRDALLKELAAEADELGPRRLTSIFFGGGTPSLMPPATAEALIEAATQQWTPADDIEITLEANPSSVEAARFADLAKAGVNRVSLGIQALDDASLAFLGRAHDSREGLAALETAQRAFTRASFDLIYALPNHNAAEWEATLRRAIAFGTEHLSLYQLTIEPGTRFATLVAKGEFTLLESDKAAELYELTDEVTRSAGLPRYEISNHARPGTESRHNLTYWRYGEYAGIGPGAHGRRQGVATRRHRKPENWIAALGRNGHGLEAEDVLSAHDQATEALLMGLRLEAGIDLSSNAMAGIVDDAAVARLEKVGLLHREGSHLRVQPQGMLVLNAILAEILA